MVDEREFFILGNCSIKPSSTTAKNILGTQINSGTVRSLQDVEMYQKISKRYKVIQLG